MVNYAVNNLAQPAQWQNQLKEIVIHTKDKDRSLKPPGEERVSDQESGRALTQVTGKQLGKPFTILEGGNTSSQELSDAKEIP